MKSLLAGLTTGLLSAALAAAASRPWGLGALALICYTPAFATILSTRSPLVGAVVAGIASLGVASVGYEATVGIFPGAYALTLLVAPLPFAAVGGMLVRFANAGASRRLAPTWRAAATALAIACLWLAAEYLSGRPELLGVWALPLGVLGYSQVDLPTAQLARLSSVTAVSGLILTVNAWLATLGLALAARRFRSAAAWRPGLAGPAAGSAAGSAAAASAPASAGRSAAAAALPALLPVICLLVLCLLVLCLLAPIGLSRATPAPESGSGQLNIRLVQPNLPDSVYAAAAEVSGVEDWLITELLTLASAAPAATNGFPTLTLLPEASWPGLIEPGVIEPGAAGSRVGSLSDAGPVLLGAVTYGPSLNDSTISGGKRAPERRKANSVLLAEDDVLSLVYDKRRLVPIAESGLAAGGSAAIVEIGGVKVAPLICYDAVFPADVRAAVRAGARLIALHTDDSFAARSDVPRLHLRVARMRAIETGVPVALVANTGPSALIDSSGALIALTSPLEATTLTATLTAAGGTTPYVRYGDWVGTAAVALSLGVGAMSVAGGGAHELDQGPT